MKLEELKLTRKARERLRPKPLDCGRCEVDVCRLTELDKARCWARKVAEAQLQKIFNHPDLYVIDKGRELPKNPYEGLIHSLDPNYDEGQVKAWKSSVIDMLEARYLPVIPLAEVLKEAQDEDTE